MWTITDVDKHKKGLSNSQKEKWIKIANSVRADCLKEGKTEEECDALAIRQANGAVNTMELVVQTNKGYPLRKEVKNGKTYLVAPVVMMVEGVHCGSHGCLLHPIEELGKFPSAWDGRPVVILHPKKDGASVSAGDPDIDFSERVGTVYNTRVDGDKLRAEVWLDEEKLKIKSLEAYQYIQNGNPMDVSVGVFTDEEDKEGEWHGEKYMKIARNHRFDHLALLPGMEGACSWADGCGIRVNSSNNFKLEDVKMSDKTKEKVDALIINEATHYSEDDREWLSKLDEGQLDKMSPKLQRNTVKPCCPEDVDLLISNDKTPFTDQDKEWLQRLSAEQLGKLFPKVEKKKEPEVTSNGSEKKVELTKEDLLKVFSQYTKAEDFIALAPKELQGQLTSGLDTYRAERKKMIAEVSKYSEFSTEELEVMNDATLRKIHSSVVPEGDYSGAGFGNNNGARKPTKEMKIMLGIKDDKNK